MKRLLLKNAVYHILVRGNQKQRVFLCEEDYIVYLNRLRKYKIKYRFLLYAFCLMPNHVHLIGESKEPINIIKFMQCLNRSYTAYFNAKHDKVGHLWQNRYKNRVVMKDQYLIDCINYVEANPVRAKLAQSPLEYRWSSCSERSLFAKKQRMLLDAMLVI